MRREFAAIVIGIGFTIVSIILPYWIPNMPDWIIYSGLGIGVVFVLIGFAMFFWKPKTQELLTSGSRYQKSPHTEGDHIGDIIYGDKITQPFEKPLITRPSTQPISDIPNEATLAICSAFVVQLDKLTKGRKFSSPAIVFLNKIKAQPPFLGIEFPKSTITLQYETYITEHFLAKEFMKGVRGGERYTVKKNDTFETLSLKVYGNTRCVSNIKENNGIASLTPGQTILFPPLNINSPSMSTNEVVEKMRMANPQWLKQKLNPLKLNLVDEEIIPIFEAIYYAAQKVRV